jgi:hypothetical protein
MINRLCPSDLCDRIVVCSSGFDGSLDLNMYIHSHLSLSVLPMASNNTRPSPATPQLSSS